MRIIYWNIRAGGGKRATGILRQLQAWQPDIIGLSEFRGTPASQWLAQELAASGYRHQLMSIDVKKPAVNALLLASHYPLTAIAPKEQWYQPQLPVRWILARVSAETPLHLGLMHIPNFTSPHKYPYYARVLRMIKNWKLGPALIGGDTNSGKKYIDEDGTNPNSFKREHAWMEGVETRGWTDAFRHLHGDKREWTWYSHRQNGFRLDHAFLDPTLLPQLAATRHEWGHDPEQPDRRDALSDHAALILDLDWQQQSIQQLASG